MRTFGLSIGASPRESIASVAELVARAEGDGFRSVYVVDSQMAVKDVYVTLTAIAMSTQKILIGTGVTNPITRDLTVTASAINALQDVANGRVRLGFGNGATAVEGIGLKGATLADVEQAVRNLKALLAGQEVLINGQQVRMHPSPRPVPILLSASRPKMLALAARVADGVILMGSSDPELVKDQIAIVLSSLSDSGRDRNDFIIDLWQTISISDNRRQALDDVKPWVASVVWHWFSRSADLPPKVRSVVDPQTLQVVRESYAISEHLSLRARHGSYINDDLADMMAIAGESDYCIGKLRALYALGVDQITLSLLSRDRDLRLRQLSDVTSKV